MTISVVSLSGAFNGSPMRWASERTIPSSSIGDRPTNTATP
jgi:hypothetical protein